LDPRRNCLLSEELHEFSIDLPLVNGQPFGSIACIGFDALVNRLARDQKGYLGGTPGYVICVLKALRAFHSFDIGITIDDFFWQGRVMMIAVANGRFYGGGMKIAPGARMDDGLFEVCVIEEVSKRELIREFPKVFRGTHVRHPRCLIRSGKTVKIASPEEREVFADGEHVSNLPVLCTMGERKISVLLPERSMSVKKGG
jgi:diacylglycerol kinase (ATP)